MPRPARLTDSHIHLFAGGFPGAYGPLFPGGGEVKVYDAIRGVHNVERTLVIGYEGDEWAAGNNKYIAKLAQTHKWITPLAFCPVASSPSAKQLQALWKAGFYGITIYINNEDDANAVLSWGDEAIAGLDAKQAIVSINSPMALLRKLRPFIARFNSASVLISHIGLPGRIGPKTTEASARKLLAPLLALVDLPQVGVKFSGFYDSSAYPHEGMAPVQEVLKAEFGAKRLYWGSDFSPALDTVTYGQTIDAIIPLKAAEQKAIFADNLIRVIDRVL